MKSRTTPSGWDEFVYKILVAFAKSKMAFEVVPENTYYPVEGLPIIFAANHSNSFDIPNASKAAGRHIIPLLGKQRLALIDRIFFRINGVIYVDRMDKKSSAAVKKKLLRALKGRLPVVWFPEGTWNLTDNLLMLNMKWGIVDVAKKGGAQVIPLAFEYDRDTMICRAKFGSPIFGNALTDKAAAIRALRDAMATLRWELISEYPVVSRKEADIDRMREKIMMAIPEYPYLEPEKEAAVIFQPFSKGELLPELIVPKKENAFLFNKRLLDS